MIRGQAGQPVACNIRNATTGAPWTTPVNVWVAQNGGVAVLGTVGGGSVTPDARGRAVYIPSALENNYADLDFTFDAVGAIGDTISIETIPAQTISALQTATGLASVVVSQLIKEAFIEIRVGRTADSLEPGQLLWGLEVMNRIIDKWNADPLCKYDVDFTSYTPTLGGHTPHTIGPNAADWAATQRPDRIHAANLVLNTVTPAVRIPINIRDDEWWQTNTVQGLSSAIVTDLYYAPSWPNGEINLWPLPTIAYPIELKTDVLLGRYTLTDVLWLPFGYREALTLTLAERLAPGSGQEISADLRSQATDARVIVFGNNIAAARNIRTRDGGMPGGRRGGRYLYRTGFNK